MTAPLTFEIFTWLITAFFFVGAAINFIAPTSIRADYARWGYPGWFHYVTALLELAVALQLLFPATRLQGAALGALVMLAAVGTTLTHREYKRAIAPFVVLLLTLALAWSMLAD